MFDNVLKQLIHCNKSLDSIIYSMCLISLLLFIASIMVWVVALSRINDLCNMLEVKGDLLDRFFQSF